MAMSLAFHIRFAVVGIGMPLMMVIAEWRWLRTLEEAYLELARRWAQGTAIFFAVGAVSGTVLSFELGLLWPQFMEWAGPIARRICLLWALAQFPYLVEPKITIYNAAAPVTTLRVVLIALVAGALLLMPSFYYLLRVFKGGSAFGTTAQKLD